MLKNNRESIRKSKFISILFMVLHIAGFVSSIDAVMGTRTSQGAIAWVISLNTFLSIALPAYWVKGRSQFNGYVKASLEDESELSYVGTRIREDKS